MHNIFKFGYPKEIDQYLKFKKTDLIMLGGRPAMGTTTFALNILRNNGKSKGCLISLRETKEDLVSKINKIDETENLFLHLKESGIESTEKSNYQIKYLELPTLLELIEFITSFKDEFDYFIIDELANIDSDINPLFSDDKNYQYILRHLKVLCLTMNKNIILLSNIDRKIEETENRFSFGYYGTREKFVDYIFVLHRPEYYRITKNELDENFKKGETIFYFAKSKGYPKQYKSSLIFDRNKLIFTSIPVEFRQ